MTKSLWEIADENIPFDVREVAHRCGMSETLIEIWRGAFIDGWRASSKNYLDGLTDPAIVLGALPGMHMVPKAEE